MALDTAPVESMWKEKRVKDTGGMISDMTPNRSGPVRPLISTNVGEPRSNEGNSSTRTPENVVTIH